MTQRLAREGRSQKRLACLLTILLLAAAPVTGISAPPGQDDIYSRVDLEKLQRTFEHIAHSVSPCVVAVRTYREVADRRGQTAYMPNSQGSGFVYRSDGYIVTNHHVIDGADRIEIVLSNGDDHVATIVQFDPRSDLAMLKIDARNLHVATLGDLSEVQQGSWVFTAGNPFGLANDDGNTSVSFGTVSALGRMLPSDIPDARDSDRYYGNLIQTDASVNPGNSGGPLFDLKGHVIGVATAMYSASGVNEGVGFAIPLSERTRGILELLADGKVAHYGYLGVNVSTPSRDDAKRAGMPSGHGARIVSLPESSSTTPAAAAGLRDGDVLATFDGVRLEGADHLIRLVGATPVDSVVDVTYYRDGRLNTTKIRVGERPETIAARIRAGGEEEINSVKSMTWRGITLGEPTEAFLISKGLGRRTPGVFVIDLPDDSLAHKRGLRKHAMIRRVNGERVRTLDDFSSAVERAGNAVRLELRDGTIIALPN